MPPDAAEQAGLNWPADKTQQPADVIIHNQLSFEFTRRFALLMLEGRRVVPLVCAASEEFFQEAPKGKEERLWPD